MSKFKGFTVLALALGLALRPGRPVKQPLRRRK